MLASHVLHLLADWQGAVDEAVRVLHEGGALFVDFGGGVAAPWSEPTEQVMNRLGDKFARRCGRGRRRAVARSTERQNWNVPSNAGFPR